MSERIGKYLTAIPQPATGKTGRWRIESNRGDYLGSVQWYGPWRQFTFDPEILSTFNVDCLNDISAFLVRENAKQRESAKPLRAMPLFGGGA